MLIFIPRQKISHTFLFYIICIIPFLSIHEFCIKSIYFENQTISIKYCYENLWEKLSKIQKDAHFL